MVDYKKIIENQYKIYYKKFLKILGKLATSETQLTDVAKSLFKNKFKGVFAKDDSFKVKQKGYYIINTATRETGGQHWCAVADGIFFDSFGRSSTKIGFKKILQNIQTANTEQDKEQYITELTCGVHCMCFLYLHDKYGSKYSIWI